MQRVWKVACRLRVNCIIHVEKEKPPKHKNKKQTKRNGSGKMEKGGRHLAEKIKAKESSREDVELALHSLRYGRGLP